MLGIRNRSGIAIDLWVGHPDLFLCDTRINEEADLSLFSEWNQAMEFVQVTNGSRHLALTPKQSDPPDEVLLTLMHRFPNYKRITLILHSVALHASYLDAFTRVFPEDKA